MESNFRSFYSRLATEADKSSFFFGGKEFKVEVGDEIWTWGKDTWETPEIQEMSAFALLFIYHDKCPLY